VLNISRSGFVIVWPMSLFVRPDTCILTNNVVGCLQGNRTQIKLKNDQYVVTGFRKFARRCAKVPTRVSRAVQWRGSNPESPAPSS